MTRKVAAFRKPSRATPPTVESLQPLKARQSLGWLIRDLSRAMARAIQRRVARHNVSLGHWYLLRALWEQDQLTIRELSTVIGVADSSALKALEQMEREGLITRSDDADDRRKSVVALTKKGSALKSELLPYVASIRTKATKGMTAAEVDLLEQLLDLMLKNLTADD